MHITATKQHIIVCAIEDRPRSVDGQVELIKAGAAFVSHCVEAGIEPDAFGAVTMIAGKVVRELLAPDSNIGFPPNTAYIILEDKDAALDGDAYDHVTEGVTTHFGPWLRMMQ